MDVMPMKDMALSPSEAVDFCCPTPADAPRYPYGLSISLCGDELEKLDIDFEDLCVGDMVHLHCMGVITSKSCSERQDAEPNERVEIQITHIACENEDEENEADEEEEDSKSNKRLITTKLYNKK